MRANVRFTGLVGIPLEGAANARTRLTWLCNIDFGGLLPVAVVKYGLISFMDCKSSRCRFGMCAARRALTASLLTHLLSTSIDPRLKVDEMLRRRKRRSISAQRQAEAEHKGSGEGESEGEGEGEGESKPTDPLRRRLLTANALAEERRVQLEETTAELESLKKEKAELLERATKAEAEAFGLRRRLPRAGGKGEGEEGREGGVLESES